VGWFSGNVGDFYLGGAWFESQLGYQLFLPRPLPLSLKTHAGQYLD
jgi:hypothetical protein